MKIPACKVIWFGVYKKSFIFGRMCRFLQAVVQDYKDAEEWLNKELKANSWQKREDYMIEEVDIRMRAWDPAK